MTTILNLKGRWALACAAVLALAWLLYTQPALVGAHGTNSGFSMQSNVQVDAKFDTGEPMAEAQISVYKPNDPENAWIQGIADENGSFVFDTDPEVLGIYNVSIRSAGHGEILSVPVGVIGNGSGNGSFLQQLIMAAAVIWGFIGTALYFSARKTEPAVESVTGAQ